MGQDNSLQVEVFDVEGAKRALQFCPFIVRDYVKLLEENSNRWQNLTATALGKIKELSQELNTLKNGK